MGKYVSILKGPRKGYRGIVTTDSRDDTFIVKLDIVGQECTVRWADLALIW